MPDHQAKFVKPAEGLPSSLLEKAYETLRSRDINPLWISQEDALKISAAEKYCIYVLDPFVGEAFTHLETLGCRTYGPPCVLSCSEAEKPLPKQPYPQYSTSMRGLLVCFSNIENDERDRLMRMVRFMGGEVMKVLTEHVTHLVTNQVGSKKYIVATSSLKIPIMLPDWVDKAWDASRQGKIHAASEDFKKFACPIFKGVHVSVSGLDQQERKRVQAALEDNGGVYSGEMRRDKTTHLITTEPKGQKYSFAAKWKIHIVHPQWLHDSLHNNYCEDETLHKVDSNKTSTPTKCDQHGLPSLENMSSIMSASMINITSLNETVNSTINNRASMSLVPCKDGLDDLEMKSGDLLDGCKVYLSGFCGERLDKIRKYIGLASGTRFSILNDDITHVIVNGKIGQSLIDEVRELQCPPHVVTLTWLIESQKSGKLLPEEEFSCLEKSDDVKFSPVAQRAVRKSEVSSSSLHADNEMSDLLSQYMTNASDDTTKGDEVDDDVTRLDCDVTTLDHDVTTLEENDTTVRGEEGGLFAGKQFVILGFDEEAESDLRAIVDELSGSVHGSKSRGVPHYAVVPPFGCPVTMAVDDVVTSLWIQQCHEENQLLNLEENALYRPVTVNSESEPLKNCVLAITGFTGMERDCLLHLAKTLGAVVQEYFCKKTSAKAQASTHLLASLPDGLHGSKYEAALKMRVPVVTKEWLLKCAKTGTRLPESEFGPESAQGLEKTDTVEPSSRKTDTVEPSSRKTDTVEQSRKTDTVENNKEEPISQKTEQVEQIMLPPTKAPSKTSLATPSGSRSNQRILELQKSATPSDKPKDLTNMTPNTALANIEFDLDDMLKDFDTPASQKKPKRKSSISLEDLYHHHINIALRRFTHPDEFQSPAPAESQNEEDSEGKPLRGVVISVSRKLADKQSEYFNMVTSLGGDYRWVYDTSCSHYICQGKGDSSKEYKQAKEKVKYIVSPYWLIMCEQQNSRVDEGLFPANFNPSMSLCVTTPRQTPVTRRQARLTRPAADQTASPALVVRKPAVVKTPEKVVDVPTTSRSGETTGEEEVEKSPTLKNLDLDVKTPTKEDSGSLAMQQVIQKELEDIMANSKSSSSNSAPRRKSRRPDTGSRSGRQPRTKSKVEEEDLCSQQAEVTWDDPNSRKEREKFVDVLHKPYSPTQHPESQTAVDPPKFDFLKDKDAFLLPAPSPRPGRDEDRPPPTPEPPSLTFPRPRPSVTAQSPQPVDPPSVTTDEVVEPKILMSGMTQSEKDNYGALIESLGGTLLESNTFDARCTHLIAGQPTRNEKCLASIASGKWILHKSYLEACRSTGMFVKEDDHEWGTAGTLAVKNPQAVVKLSEAAHRWRVKLQRKRQGAFHEWKVIICTPKNKTGGFKRLLEAGGAKVLTSRPPFSNFLSVATHAFMDLPKCEVEVDLEEFVRAGVPCYKPEFIAGFLMDEFLDKDSYVIPELGNNNTTTSGKKRKSSGSSTEVAKKSKLT